MNPNSAFNEVPRDLLDAWDPEGDFTRIHMLNPVIFAALGDVRGQRILDAGCGQGYLCRLLAKKGATMVGLEPSRAMFEFANDREVESPLGIEYVQGDLSRSANLTGPFDAVIANMVLMDIPDWEEAMRTCVGVLRSGGLFVYSVTHPCFEESTESWPEKGFVAVEEYLAEYETPMHYGLNYHRTLSAYINETISLGCTLKELVEPGIEEEIANSEDRAAKRLVHVPSCLVVVAEKV